MSLRGNKPLLFLDIKVGNRSSRRSFEGGKFEVCEELSCSGSSRQAHVASGGITCELLGLDFAILDLLLVLAASELHVIGDCCSDLKHPLPSKLHLIQHTCNRILAASTLLGNTLLVAFDTVKLILYSCEALPAQLLLAVGANETLRMPRLFLVSEASRSDGLEGKEQRCVL